MDDVPFNTSVAGSGRTLIIACGALAHEITALLNQPGLQHVSVKCLPAELHNRPEKIPTRVQRSIRLARKHYEQIFVAYGDCGTGGLLDAVLAKEGVSRLPGAHCYAFFGGKEFTRLQCNNLGTFYLTDFLVRFFDRVIWRGLKLDQYPELLDTYFANYNTLAYLAQTNNPDLIEQGRSIAGRMNLEYIHRYVGYGALAPVITNLQRRVS